MRRRLTLFLFLFVVAAMTSSTPAGSSRLYVSVAGEQRIKCYEISENGDLKEASALDLPGEPGALVAHPTRGLLLASLRSTGQLASLSMDPNTGALSILNIVDAGADPAFVAVDRSGRWLLSAYYRAGKVSVHGLQRNGRLQAWPTHSLATDVRAHAVAIDPSNQFVLVPHTGPNAIHQFRFRSETGQLSANDPAIVQTGENTGPRHTVFHPTLKMAYADNEQGSSVTAFAFDSERGTVTARQTLSTLPPDFSERNSCARLQMSASGRLLFAANRGHNSIAVFAIDESTGALTATDRATTEPIPRGFSIASDDRFLYAAGQESGRIAGYRVDADNGTLTHFGTWETGSRPWWVEAVELP